jgi:hypothetical protein
MNSSKNDKTYHVVIGHLLIKYWITQLLYPEWSLEFKQINSKNP